MMEYTRITADLSPEAYEVLTDISLQLNTSKAEVLRKALGLFNFIRRQQQPEEGRTVILENKKTKERKELVVL